MTHEIASAFYVKRNTVRDSHALAGENVETPADSPMVSVFARGHDQRNMGDEKICIVPEFAGLSPLVVSSFRGICAAGSLAGPVGSRRRTSYIHVLDSVRNPAK